MIKRIIRIILCIISFAGFSLIAVSTALRPPTSAFFHKVTAMGTGLTPTNSYMSNDLNKPILPYSYISLPRDAVIPLAIEYYDSLPPEDNISEGQDPQQPQTPQEPTLPAGTFPIIPLDLSDNQTPDDLHCKNDSKYSPDINELFKEEYPLTYTKTVSTNNEIQPLVLIIHTHGTECYTPDGSETYTTQTLTRTQDTSANVVAVGKALAEQLNTLGVPTLHCTAMFDAESYSDSYTLSEKAVLDYLKKYPSIQYVFDVHRDSIVRANNEKVKPYTTINGIPTAQAMFVVGTDSGGANHPNWIHNLTVATYFQNKLIEKYGNIMRPINLRSASFNAEHTPGSILIEIGSCGNTLSEAKNCASFLGSAIAEIILNDGKV